MNCKKCHSKLVYYLEGTLSENLRAEMEAHLRECAACKEFAVYFEESLQLMVTESKMEPKPFLHTRTKAKMEKTAGTPVRTSLQLKLQPLFFSILLIVAIYSGIKMGSHFTTTGNEDYISDNLAPMLNELGSERLEMFLMD
jgi:anti-sigma factor RsiW